MQLTEYIQNCVQDSKAKSAQQLPLKIIKNTLKFLLDQRFW